MPADDFPNVAMTGQDRGYRGSTFAEVRKALFANPYQKIWGAAAADVSDHARKRAARLVTVGLMRRTSRPDVDTRKRAA